MGRGLKYKNQGNMLYGKRQYQEALTAFESAIEEEPTLEAAWLNKGLCHKKLNQPCEAVASFQKAIEIKPSYQKAMENLSDCFFNEGRYKEALYWAQESIAQGGTLRAEYIREQCSNKISAKMFFGIMDLKLKEDGEIKILEFGRGVESGATGVLHCYGRPIESILQEAISDRQLSLLLNGACGDFGLSDDKGADLERFLKGVAPCSLESFNPEVLAGYQAVYGSWKTKKVPIDLLVLDESVLFGLVCGEKVLLHNLMEKEHSHLRPAARVYPKHYFPELVDRILEDFPEGNLVIKASDMQEGRGVIVIEKNRKKLDGLLRKLLVNIEEYNQLLKKSMPRLVNKIASTMPKSSTMSLPLFQHHAYELWEQKWAPINSWRISDASIFLVESYEASKFVCVKNKHYDGTMRVHFLAIREEGCFSFKPLSAYWKLPNLPIDGNDLRGSTVSSVGKEGANTLAVTAEDEAHVFQILSRQMPSFFNRLLTTDVTQLIQGYQISENNFLQKYAQHLTMRRANIFGMTGQFNLAIDEINKIIKQTNANTYKPFHERGIIYHNEGFYDKAIQAFDKALSIEKIAATFYRRGKTYQALGAFDAAMGDFREAQKIAPEDKRYQAEIARLHQAQEASRIPGMRF